MNDLIELPVPFVYQDYIRQKIITRLKTCVIMRPGGGKTRPIIEALVALGILLPEFPEGPVIIVCSGPAVATWRWQIPYWSQIPELSSHIHICTGDTTLRRQKWAMAKESGRGIYITNSMCFLKDKKEIFAVHSSNTKPGEHWAALIADEYHKYMRRRKSGMWEVFKTMSRHIRVVVPLTGSGLAKNPASMWTAFYTCDPLLPLFRSYWRFAKTFCHSDMGEYGVELYGARNVENFKKITDRYLAYIPDEVVSENQPKGLRSRLHVEMSAKQLKAYTDLNEEMILDLEGDLTVTPTVMSKLTTLRKLLCCPKIVHPSLDWGGGLEAIGDTLDTQAHVAIFVPFRDACDAVRQYLWEKHGLQSRILMGGVSPEEQDEILQWFRAERGIVIGTIDYAESYDLETCDTTFMLGYTMKLYQNQQAEGRTQRASSKCPFVKWQYVYYPETVDDHFLEMFNTDHQTIMRVLERPQGFIQMLKGKKA